HFHRTENAERVAAFRRCVDMATLSQRSRGNEENPLCSNPGGEFRVNLLELLAHDAPIVGYFSRTSTREEENGRTLIRLRTAGSRFASDQKRRPGNQYVPVSLSQ